MLEIHEALGSSIKRPERKRNEEEGRAGEERKEKGGRG